MYPRAVLILVLIGLLQNLFAVDPAAGDEAPPELPSVTIPRLSGAVTVDGHLDEAVWGAAVNVSGFQPASKRGGSPTEDTVLLLWYDETALYFGWQCADRDIRATMTARDSRFWEEEVVEVFLTAAALTRYFELEWNPLGGVFDAIIENTLDEEGRSLGIEGDWDWTAEGMTWAARMEGTSMNGDDRDTGWWVEVRLPFAALGEPAPAPGTRWRGNFFRINRHGWRTPESIAWSPPLTGTFHQPSRFGYLIFGDQPEPIPVNPNSLP